MTVTFLTYDPVSDDPHDPNWSMDWRFRRRFVVQSLMEVRWYIRWLLGQGYDPDCSILLEIEHQTP